MALDERLIVAFERIASALERIAPEAEPVTPGPQEVDMRTFGGPCTHPPETRIDYGVTKGVPDWECGVCHHRTVSEG